MGKTWWWPTDGNPGVSIKLNEPLLPTADIDASGFAIAGGGSRVVYRADNDTDGVHELYSVDIATPGVATKFSTTPVPGDGDVSNKIALSEDGQLAVYVGNLESSNVQELYAYDFTGAGQIKLSSTPVGGGNVESFALTPDKSKVI